MLLWQKTVYLNVLLQKMFKIMIKSSPESFGAMVDSVADPSARNLKQREKFYAKLSQACWTTSGCNF